MRVRLLLATTGSIATVLAWHYFGSWAFPTLFVLIGSGWAWYVVIRLGFRRWAAHVRRVFDQFET